MTQADLYAAHRAGLDLAGYQLSAQDALNKLHLQSQYTQMVCTTMGNTSSFMDVVRSRSSIERRWERRMLRIQQKLWTKRWLRIQGWVWAFGLAWALLAATAITAGLIGLAMRTILG